VQDMMYVSIVY